MQQGSGTRSLMEEYKEKRRKEIIHKRIIKKEWMSMECENMELLRKQHECRKLTWLERSSSQELYVRMGMNH